MSVKIRLKRVGARNHPVFRIVVADGRKRRDGAAIEELGTYHPNKKGDNFTLNLDRAQYWIGQGAQPSSTVSSFIKKAIKGPSVEKAPAPAPAAAKAAEAPAAAPKPVPAAAAPAAAAPAAVAPAPEAAPAAAAPAEAKAPAEAPSEAPSEAPKAPEAAAPAEVTEATEATEASEPPKTGDAG